MDINSYLIKGGIHNDTRGTIKFVNEFDFENIKRFYSITHHDKSEIRAWQGHKLETKYFYVTKGSFLVNWIKVDNWDDPTKNPVINSKVLTSNESEVLVVPPGYVNGFKALESGSTVIIFSDMTLEDSKNDDYRFDVRYWRLQNEKE